jgi:hypothetical protein
MSDFTNVSEFLRSAPQIKSVSGEWHPFVIDEADKQTAAAGAWFLPIYTRYRDRIVLEHFILQNPWLVELRAAETEPLV